MSKEGKILHYYLSSEDSFFSEVGKEGAEGERHLKTGGFIKKDLGDLNRRMTKRRGGNLTGKKGTVVWV